MVDKLRMIYEKTGDKHLEKILACRTRKLLPLDERQKQRDVQIITLLAEGLTNEEIGKKINLSNRTIGTYVSEMILRHDCKSRTGLAVKALAEGIITNPFASMKTKRTLF